MSETQGASDKGGSLRPPDLPPLASGVRSALLPAPAGPGIIGNALATANYPMTKTPPFDPPYITLVQTDSGVVRIETLADGSTREVQGPAASPPRQSALPVKQPPNSRSSGIGTVPSASKPTKTLTGGTDRALTFLDVPFAEKDAAKRLGARWDGKAKKWYAPHGVDVNLFSAWWPQQLKEEMGKR
jgi:hypothetical protein